MSIWKTGGHIYNECTFKTSVWRCGVLTSSKLISCSDESVRLSCWFSPEKRRMMWAVLLHKQLIKVTTQSFTSMQTQAKKHKGTPVSQVDYFVRRRLWCVWWSVGFVFFGFGCEWWPYSQHKVDSLWFWQLRFLHLCSINHWSVPGSCWKWNQRQSDVLVSVTLI